MNVGGRWLWWRGPNKRESGRGFFAVEVETKGKAGEVSSLRGEGTPRNLTTLAGFFEPCGGVKSSVDFPLKWPLATIPNIIT